MGPGEILSMWPGSLATLPVVEPLYSWCISQGLALWCAGTESDSDLHFAMLV